MALLHGKGHGGVVDILRGEAEVDELLEVGQAHLVEFMFEEVLHGLHVVVGGLLYLLDGEGVVVGEMTVDIAQGLGLAGHGGQRRTLPFELLAQGNEIFHLRKSSGPKVRIWNDSARRRAKRH